MTNLNNSKILVTGAGGFIGSQLVERLVGLGATTRAMVRYSSTGSRGWLEQSSVKDDFEVAIGDVRDPDGIKKAVSGVDVVFHLAALIGIPYSYQSPIAYARTNVEGTLNVLQASLDHGVGLVVQTSTSEVYGSARYTPIDEAHPLQGQSPYSSSKIGADKMAEAFHLSFGLPVTVVRPFNAFGPRQSSRAVIPTIITQALSNSEIRLGNLAPMRDFTYVTDTVEGFIKAAECTEAIGQVTNIGTGNSISIGDLATKIIGLTGKKISIFTDQPRVRPEGSEVNLLQADSTKARNLLSWSPQHSLEQGLVKTIAWIEQNLDKFRIDSYTV